MTNEELKETEILLDDANKSEDYTLAEQWKGKINELKGVLTVRRNAWEASKVNQMGVVGREEIAKKQEFTMQIHASMKGYLEKLNDLSSLKGSVLIYSMWQGYKTEGIVREMLEALNKMGVEVIDLHISGHASKNAQELLIKNIKPKNTIFVHKKGEEK